MKFTKIIAIISAFALLAGCSEKKKPESSSEITGEPVAVEDENIYRTYSYEDFKEIEVPWNETDKEPPVELKCYKFPDYDFGERVPPCMSSEDPMKYYYDYEYYESMENELEKKQIYDEFMKNANKPQRPIIERFQRDGNKLYVTVNYDTICYMHEWSIYCFDMVTNEMTEIYNYSGLDNVRTQGHAYGTIIDNVLYITLNENDRSYLTAIDLDTKEETVIMESAYSITLQEKTDGGLFICEQIFDGDRSEGDYSDDGSLYKYYDFNTETKELSETEFDAAHSTYTSEGFIKAYIEKPEGSRSVDLITENYRLSTGVTAANIFHADDKKAILITPDDKPIMHIFDFGKMEHYVTELKKDYYGYVFGDGLVLRALNGSQSYVYYFLPELGLAFRLTDYIDTVCFSKADNIVYFIKQSTMENDDKNNNNIYSRYEEYYWLEEKEQ